MSEQKPSPEQQKWLDRRNELLDLVLAYTQSLRRDTKDMNNEERVFFLETLRMGIKAAEDKFRTGPPESK